MRTTNRLATRGWALGILVLMAGAAPAAAQGSPVTPTPATKPYSPSSQNNKPSSLPPSLDLRGKSKDEIIGAIKRRAEWRSSGDSPVGVLQQAGCLCCHRSLDGISVHTFVRHVEARFSRRYGCTQAEAFGGSDAFVALMQQDESGQDKLKQSIDASGMEVRQAGSMAAEMAREKWEAARKTAAAKDAVVAKSDYEQALELVAAAKYTQALPLLKSYVASEMSRQQQQSLAGNADGTQSTISPPATTESEPSPGGKGTTGAGVVTTPTVHAELEDTRRVLAFVLLGAGQPDAASAVLREMYRLDPQLAKRSLRLEAFGVAERELRTQFAASVTFANKAKTGSSWLLAAVLAQAERRWPLARTLVDRGVAAGLERDIADAMAVAIDESIAADSGNHAAPKAAKPSAAKPKEPRDGRPTESPK